MRDAESEQEGKLGRLRYPSVEAAKGVFSKSDLMHVLETFLFAYLLLVATGLALLAGVAADRHGRDHAVGHRLPPCKWVIKAAYEQGVTLEYSPVRARMSSQPRQGPARAHYKKRRS